MSLTAYHARYFAHELTKRSSSDDVDKLASALSDAQVDLNPHQIEAALFAFRSPLSKGLPVRTNRRQSAVEIIQFIENEGLQGAFTRT